MFEPWQKRGCTNGGIPIGGNGDGDWFQLGRGTATDGSGISSDEDMNRKNEDGVLRQQRNGRLLAFLILIDTHSHTIMT